MITMGKKKKGARRAYVRRPSRRMDFFLIWIKRFGLGFAVCVAVIWAGAWLWLSGAVDNAAAWTRQATLDTSVKAGFSVSNILVEGRVYTDADILMGILNTKRGDPLLAFDPEFAKNQIQRISWVHSVIVERRFPDTIYVGLVERTPIALWQKDQKLHLIDKSGVILTNYDLNRFAGLLMIAGDKAPMQAELLVNTLNAEPLLKEHIESAQWVGERRWNLKTKRGVLVKLPENDIGLALKRLSVAHADSALLEKTLEHIDLRNPDRIIIQTAPGMVQEFSIENFLKAGYQSGDDI